MFQRSRSELPRAPITDPRALAALASPIRQELVDTLEALDGTATVAELAEQLGLHADGLYYHVEVLRRAGLVVAAPVGRSRAGRSERRYRLPGRGRLRAIGYRPGDRRAATAIRDVVRGMLRVAGRDFDRAFVGDVVTEGALRELWAGRRTGWVSDAELAQINRVLAGLLQRLGRPRGGPRHRLISLCFVLTPMTARPAERRRPASSRPERRSQRRARPAA